MTAARAAAVGGVVVALALLPQVAGPFWMGLATQMIVFGLLALSVDLLLGHAGLFSTAADLARICRMLVSGGMLDGRRVLRAATIQTICLAVTGWTRPASRTPVSANGSANTEWLKRTNER